MMLFSLLLGNSLVVIAADFNKGYEAFNIGDYETAIEEWLPLAEQGDGDSQFNLALMYRSGEGVLQNHKTAIEWYTKAAEQGHAKAQFNLALMYRSGEGVLQNDKTAEEWYTKAAEQGDASAQ